MVNFGEEDIFTGVPAVVNQEGVREIIELRLDPKEKNSIC